MVIAFLLAAIFADGNQLSTMLILTAIFSVVSALVLLVALRKPGEHKAAHHRPDRNALKVAWGDSLIRRLCVLAIFPFGVFVAMTTFAQALLEPAGVSGETASTILLVNVVVGVIGSAVIPVIVVRHRAESALLVMSLLLTALACTALAIVPSALMGFVAITVIGFLLLPALPIVLELVERRTGEAEGTGSQA